MNLKTFFINTVVLIALIALAVNIFGPTSSKTGATNEAGKEESTSQIEQADSQAQAGVQTSAAGQSAGQRSSSSMDTSNAGTLDVDLSSIMPPPSAAEGAASDSTAPTLSRVEPTEEPEMTDEEYIRKVTPHQRAQRKNYRAIIENR